MVLIDIANLAAGAYKGYANSAGMEVDSTYLAGVLAATTTLSSVEDGYNLNRENNSFGGIVANNIMGESPEDPVTFGIKRIPRNVVLNSLEIAVGYGIGWIAQKIIN